MLAQRLLEDTRLRIGAVEYGKVVVAESLATLELGYALCHNLALFHIGVCLYHLQWCTHIATRVHLLVYLLAVLLYQTVGRSHDHLCGAVVLLQLEHACPCILAGKPEDIVDIGSPERVDALRIVAHHAYMLIVACELPHDAVLCIVGILILVYQHVGKLRGILCQHLGMILKQQVGIQQYIVKVHRPSLSAAFLIAQVYLACLGHLGMSVIGHGKSIGGIHLCGHEAVLGIRYATLDHARLVHLIVELHLLDDALEQTLRVGLVIDGEVGSKANMLSLGPQYPQKHAVEGTHPQVASPMLPHPASYALTHLACRLIGKCECQYAPWLQAQFHQVGHLIGEHTGLARSCTGNHQRGSIIIGHCSQLALIEFVAYIVVHSNNLR